MEEVTVLGHHAERFPDGREAEVTDVDPAEPDRAVVHVVQPSEQLGHGGLAGAGRPDQRDHLTRLDPERGVVDDLDTAAGVEGRHLLQRGQ